MPVMFSVGHDIPETHTVELNHRQLAGTTTQYNVLCSSTRNSIFKIIKHICYPTK